MSSKKGVHIGAFFLAGAALVLAGGLSKKYKNWDKSPEAYFLTSDERAQWKKIQTDADAQNFILDYKARRGPDFEKMLAERVAAADKYLSAGETKGSETLRGKIVILFGPPSAMEAGKGSGNARANSGASPELRGQGGRDEGLAMSSGGASPFGSAPPHAQSPTVTFVYDEASVPKAIGKPFRVEVRVISNSYQEPIDPKDLAEKFEAVAKDSAKPASNPASKPQSDSEN
jgi:GWxTD domain-containing protein